MSAEAAVVDGSTSAPEDEARSAEKQFLKVCQLGQLKEAKRLLKERPQLLEARSASKGYTAMHWGAMGGATPLVEWLESLGLDPEVPSPDGTTPLQV